MPAEVVWQGTANGDGSQFEVVEGVSLATGTSVQIHVSPIDGDTLASYTVRPWFDDGQHLQAQAFAKNTPSQRQQLFFDGKQLKEDGNVLALHGVAAECTLQLVTLDEIEL